MRLDTHTRMHGLLSKKGEDVGYPDPLMLIAPGYNTQERRLGCVWC